MPDLALEYIGQTSDARRAARGVYCKGARITSPPLPAICPPYPVWLSPCVCRRWRHWPICRREYRPRPNPLYTGDVGRVPGPATGWREDGGVCQWRRWRAERSAEAERTRGYGWARVQ